LHTSTPVSLFVSFLFALLEAVGVLEAVFPLLFPCGADQASSSPRAKENGINDEY